MAGPMFGGLSGKYLHSCVHLLIKAQYVQHWKVM